jgi:antirestriction protein ArdC
VLWKRSVIKEKQADGTTEEKTIMWAKIYKVFAAEQTDVPAEKLERLRKREPLPEGAEVHDEAEALTQAYIAAEGVTLAHGGNRAYYAMLQDHVQMPPVEAFHSTEGYYGTLLHELVHSTGHSKRKDRQFGKRFGDQAYAFEELVAEIGSAFLCAATGVSTEPRADHAQYLASWIEVLPEGAARRS